MEIIIMVIIGVIIALMLTIGAVTFIGWITSKIDD